MAAKGKKANIFVWIILGLLIIGLAGFGVDGFGGSVRSIGKVGDRDIRVQDYFNALQEEMNAAQAEIGRALSMGEARAFGIDRAALSRLVTVAALENETEQLGISVGDDVVRQELLRLPAFRGFDGAFNRDAYRFALQQEGLSESAFEDQLRIDTARGILQAAVVSGAPAPQSFVDTLHAYIGQQRSFTVLRLDRGDLTEPVPAPTDAQLQAHYEENAGDFTLPEARRFSYAWITPSMIIDTVVVDDSALRELYQTRIDEFVRPERRLVERLIYPSIEEARVAMDLYLDDAVDFAELVAERGLTLEDVDMGDVTEDQLGAAGPAIFALHGPNVVGPYETSFGPALFRMNAILAAQETPFEEAEPELRSQLAQDRARRVIADQYDDFEDLLAGGATIEELAAETEMEFGEIVMRPDTTDGIAGYEDFRNAAESAGANDFPQVRTLEDGGLFVLRLDEVVPPELEPFDDVVVRVIEGWEAAEIARRLTVRAEEVIAALERGESADAMGLASDTVEGITRQGFVQGIPRALIARAFELEEGARDVVEADGAVHVIMLDAIEPPETGTTDAEALRQNLGEQLRQSLAQDLFTYYARRLESEAGIRIDQSAIDAVHQQFR